MGRTRRSTVSVPNIPQSIKLWLRRRRPARAWATSAAGSTIVRAMARTSTTRAQLPNGRHPAVVVFTHHLSPRLRLSPQRLSPQRRSLSPQRRSLSPPRLRRRLLPNHRSRAPAPCYGHATKMASILPKAWTRQKVGHRLLQFLVLRWIPMPSGCTLLLETANFSANPWIIRASGSCYQGINWPALQRRVNTYGRAPPSERFIQQSLIRRALLPHGSK